ncbi:MAG: hypothetical protein ABUL61_05995, partial [Oleiharenicola lentus]
MSVHPSLFAPSRPGRTSRALHWVSLITAFLALACALSALAGWLGHESAWRAGYLPWPALRPAMALGLIVAALGTLLQWSGRPTLYRLGNIFGALVALWGLVSVLPEAFTVITGWEQLLWGWTVSPADAVALPVRTSLTDGATLVLAGLALLQFEPARREWLGPSTVFGSILVTLSFFGLLTRLLMPADIAPGISGLGSIAAILLGVALTADHFDSGFLALVKSDNATGLIGRRLLSATLVLPPVLYALQLGSPTAPRAEQLALTTVALTFVLIGVLVFSLRRLQRIDEDKQRTEEERDRLLQRVQQQAAHLQQEVATRTNELKLLYERHRLAL